MLPNDFASVFADCYRLGVVIVQSELLGEPFSGGLIISSQYDGLFSFDRFQVVNCQLSIDN